MKRELSFVAAGSMIVLTGCTLGNQLNPVYMIEPLIDNQPAKADTSGTTPPGIENQHSENGIPGAFDLDHFTLPGQTAAAVSIIEANLVSDPAYAASERDALKSALVERSNLICDYTEAQLEGNSALLNFGFGELTAGAGALGAVFTQAVPARIFSGVAGLSGATQAQVNNAFFKNALTSAIIQKIDSTRASELALINHNNGSSISSYSLEDMLADVENYHNACSFYEGIEDIAQSAANSTSTSTQTPSGGGTIAATGTITTASTNSDRTTLTSNGTVSSH